ncbi:hypothetical protein BFP75_12485 [Maribacter sp. 4G9]|nr:hypothetical protein BFP75_12485 [Maribacter sp. 4G9]
MVIPHIVKYPLELRIPQEFLVVVESTGNTTDSSLRFGSISMTKAPNQNLNNPGLLYSVPFSTNRKDSCGTGVNKKYFLFDKVLFVISQTKTKQVPC